MQAGLEAAADAVEDSGPLLGGTWSTWAAVEAGLGQFRTCWEAGVETGLGNCSNRSQGGLEVAGNMTNIEQGGGKQVEVGSCRSMAKLLVQHSCGLHTVAGHSGHSLQVHVEVTVGPGLVGLAGRMKCQPAEKAGH